jgi:hypothetical protein
MSFASVARELSRCVLSMLETHIVMSSLIFCLALTLALRLALLLVLCLVSLMNLTMAHMVFVHERIALCLDALVKTHVFIMVIISRIGMFSLLVGSHTHFEPRHLDGPYFSYRGSCPTRPNGEVQRTVKTSSCHMVKCWISNIYLSNSSTEPSTSSHPM